MPAPAISAYYLAPIRAALGFTVAAGVLSALMLDLGQSARLTAICLLFFWLWIAWTVARRPASPTSFDLLVIRWGCLPLVVAFNVLMQIAWWWRGIEY